MLGGHFETKKYSEGRYNTLRLASSANVWQHFRISHAFGYTPTKVVVNVPSAIVGSTSNVMNERTSIDSSLNYNDGSRWCLDNPGFVSAKSLQAYIHTIDSTGFTIALRGTDDSYSYPFALSSSTWWAIG